ncbi:MAG: hypothetical protein ABJH63_11235 [Rhizobiaceae bacterium]
MLLRTRLLSLPGVSNVASSAVPMVGLAAVVTAALAVAGCTQTAKSSIGPRATMVHVAKQVQSCWFAKKGGDPALNGYVMAPEVNSHTGKPRILIVPKNNPGGLPKLVAQAETSQGQTSFTTFGPLLATADGPRLDASLRAWSRGSKTC